MRGRCQDSGRADFEETKRMNYMIEFWNPWACRWQPWNMHPTTIGEAVKMATDRRLADNTFDRRVVEVAN